MRMLRVDPLLPDAAVIAEAARVLREGGLVALPTETVYGLGANALDERAVARIYEAKGRPSFNPLIVHLADVAQVTRVTREWPERAEQLARAFWPGPLTMVLPKRAEVPDAVTAGLPSVAVRVPSHAVAHAIIAAAGVPIAAPSANRSTEVSPTLAEHVAKSLGEAVDLIVDAGPTTVGIESTVVDLTSDIPVLLRPGGISIDALRRVVGEVVRHGEVVGDAARRSPGMMLKHYAPRARVVVVGREDLERAVEAARAHGAVGLLALGVDDSPTADHVPSAGAGIASVDRILMPVDSAAYAARLYATLRALDDTGVATIVVEQPPASTDWEGVRDRIRRAGA